MTKQTKLVNCGSTIFVYDFKCRQGIKKLGFKRDLIRGSITDLKRLLLTNFVDDRLLVSFKLKMNLNEYEVLQDRINHFINQIQKSSGHSNIKYLAVLKLSPEEKDSFAHIHLITDVEMHELTMALDDYFEEDKEEEYFEKIWGDKLYINLYMLRRLLKVFFISLTKSFKSHIYYKYPKILFQSKLENPKVLWNNDAETFIKNHNILCSHFQNSIKINDKLAGQVIINEYSRYDTSPFTEELLLT